MKQVVPDSGGAGKILARPASFLLELQRNILNGRYI